MQSFAESLGLKYPIIQAPMAGCQDTNLAVACASAGVMGSIPAAMLSNEQLDAALQKLDDTGLPYGVNFFAHKEQVVSIKKFNKFLKTLEPYYRELNIPVPEEATPGRRAFDEGSLSVVCRHKPTLVSFHFGLPRKDFVDRLKECGFKIASSATTLNEARWLCSNGVDYIIAQGIEAGGHRGSFLDGDISLHSPVRDLVSQLVECVDVPVIAAGGIINSADVAELMSLGAAAVQVGTAFLMCKEATTSENHKKRLIDPTSQTCITNLFTGGFARGLRNRLVLEVGDVCKDALPFPWSSSLVTPLRAKAESLGLDDFTPLWAGVNRSGLIDGTAEDVVKSLCSLLEY